MKCAQIQQLLPAYAEDHDANLMVRRHLSSCPDCRRELEEYEALRLDMAALRTTVVEPPAALLATLQAIPSETSGVERVKTHVARHRKAYAGGLAMAVVGAAAGAALVRTRRATAAA